MASPHKGELGRWIGLILLTLALFPTGFLAWMAYMSTQACPQGFWVCGQSISAPAVWSWWLLFVLNILLLGFIIMTGLKPRS